MKQDVSASEVLLMSRLYCLPDRCSWHTLQQWESLGELEAGLAAVSFRGGKIDWLVGSVGLPGRHSLTVAVLPQDAGPVPSRLSLATLPYASIA